MLRADSNPLANEAKKRLESFAGGKIDASEGSVYETLRRRRNQAVHFYHPELLGPVAKVAVEQLIGWKLLFRRLTVAWKQQFGKFSEPLDALNSRIIRREDYLPGVFQHLTPSITEESKTKSLAKCRSCGQLSSLAAQEIFNGLIWMHCAVCEAEQASVFLPCRGDSCSHPAERSYADSIPCRHCGFEQQAETAESFSFYQHALPGFELIGWCGICGYTPRQSLIQQDNQVFCLACHHLLDSLHFSRCEWCNSDVTGPVGNALNPGCVRCHHYIVYEEGQEAAPEYLHDPEEWPKILEMISWT